MLWCIINGKDLDGAVTEPSQGEKSDNSFYMKLGLVGRNKMFYNSTGSSKNPTKHCLF